MKSEFKNDDCQLLHVCSTLNQIGFNRYVIQCTLQMFADIKCNDLDAFIMARQDAEKPDFTANSKIPKKGTLREALVGERNKILIAFDCRQIKNSIRGTLPHDTEINNDKNQSITDQLGVFAVSLGKGMVTWCFLSTS